MSLQRLGQDLLPRFFGKRRVETLDNGLTLCVLEGHQAPVVTTALWYRVGTRDEPAGQAGVAHFLEHMMFKGSPSYGPGEVDRITQALGGVNNAFTSHDATAYYFKFASDRWIDALKIEADRMAGLTLTPSEVASERQVILEEIAMYENEPWDALEMEVQKVLFPGHPYGRPVVGLRREVQSIDVAELRSFHERYYRPANAVLVVAGDVGDEVDALVREAFAPLAGGRPDRPKPDPQAPGRSTQRVERRQGEIARMVLARPAPSASAPDHPGLRLLLTLLAEGRASRLHRALVEEGQRCIWVSSELSETQEAGFLMLALEVVPGTEPAAVESELLELVASIPSRPPTPEEVRRAKQVAIADWIFEHERIHQQAMSAGFAVSLFDVDYSERYLRQLLATESSDLIELAARYLCPDRTGVVGWSYPA